MKDIKIENQEDNTCDNCGELLRDVCVGREKNRQLFGCRLREEKREFGTLRDDWRWRSRRWLHR